MFTAEQPDFLETLQYMTSQTDDNDRYNTVALTRPY